MPVGGALMPMFVLYIPPMKMELKTIAYHGKLSPLILCNKNFSTKSLQFHYIHCKNKTTQGDG